MDSTNLYNWTVPAYITGLFAAHSEALALLYHLIHIFSVQSDNLLYSYHTNNSLYIHAYTHAHIYTCITYTHIHTPGWILESSVLSPPYVFIFLETFYVVLCVYCIGWYSFCRDQSYYTANLTPPLTH